MGVSGQDLVVRNFVQNGWRVVGVERGVVIVEAPAGRAGEPNAPVGLRFVQVDGTVTSA